DSQPAGVAEQLPDRDRRNVFGTPTLDVLSDPVVQVEPTLLNQLEDRRRDDRLGVGRHLEQSAGLHRQAFLNVSPANRLVQLNVAVPCDQQDGPVNLLVRDGLSDEVDGVFKNCCTDTDMPWYPLTDAGIVSAG